MCVYSIILLYAYAYMKCASGEAVLQAQIMVIYPYMAMHMHISHQILICRPYSMTQRHKWQPSQRRNSSASHVFGCLSATCTVIFGLLHSIQKAAVQQSQQVQSRTSSAHHNAIFSTKGAQHMYGSTSKYFVVQRSCSMLTFMLMVEAG